MAINRPEGIAGWLLLPAVSLILAPFFLGYQFLKDVAPDLSPHVLHALASPQSSVFHPELVAVVVYSAVSILALLSFALWVAWEFFAKSKQAPKLYTIFVGALVAAQIIDLALLRWVPSLHQPSTPVEKLGGVVRSAMSASIWIPYFLLSERVKIRSSDPCW